jgi:hypothetical protein
VDGLNKRDIVCRRADVRQSVVPPMAKDALWWQGIGRCVVRIGAAEAGKNRLCITVPIVYASGGRFCL